MKELIQIVKDYGVTPFVQSVGWFTITMFVLSMIPKLSFIPKAVMLFLLTIG